jgi:ADP-ribose pyrophosphatase YjhB (NUDIX family)
LSYPLLCAVWRWTGFSSHVVQVAVWSNGKVLLIRNSYRDIYSLPGGDKSRKEISISAASRELLEETGVIVPHAQLTCVLKLSNTWRNIHKYDEIFECRLESKPNIKIDNREVIHADFYALDAALLLPLSEVTYTYLRLQSRR